MASLFLSHSSGDKLAAVALKHWLAWPENGWGEVFLDNDPRTGIAPGEAWQKVINHALKRAEAVIFLISPRWDESQWCFHECQQAKVLNKPMFGVLLEPVTPDRLGPKISAEQQTCSVRGAGPTVTVSFHYEGVERSVEFLAEGLQRLRDGLDRARIASDNFPWPPPGETDRAPFRGLLPLDVQDAAVFCGRDVEILSGLDALRGLRTSPDQRRLFVILGASGTGKSSFLRAGLIPRLRRDDRNFLPLEVVRPQQNPISGEHGLAQSLAKSMLRLGLPADNLGALKAKLRSGTSGFADVLRKIRRTAQERLIHAPGGPPPPAPTIVLPVDQAEELFNADSSSEAGEFLRLIADVLRVSTLQSGSEAIDLVVVFTIRSDRYEPLQTAPQLADFEQFTFNGLLPMPATRFAEVIHGPARAVVHGGGRLSIRPDLVNELVRECESSADPLPLLALTLSRLHADYGADGDLTLEEYHQLGGLPKVIETQVNQVVGPKPEPGADPKSTETIAGPRQRNLDILRRAFLPELVSLNPANGQPMRRVARRRDLPPEAWPLLDALAERRLLTSDRRNQEPVYEVSHEAVLRNWRELVQWIADEQFNLKEADALVREAEAWSQCPEDISRLWRGKRLDDALQLSQRAHYKARLSPCAAFLERSRAVESAELKERERKRRRQLQLAILLAALACVGALAAGVFGFRASQRLADATRERDRSQLEEGKAWLERATAAADRGDDLGALLFAGRAIGFVGYGRKLEAPSSGAFSELLGGRISSDPALESERARHYEEARQLIESCENPIVPTWSSAMRHQHDLAVNSVSFSPRGTRIASGSYDRTVKLWDLASGREIATFTNHQGPVTSVSFSPDGARLVSGSHDHTVRLWDLALGKEIATFTNHNNAVTSVVFSPDGTRIVSGSHDSTVKLWDFASGKEIATFTNHNNAVTSVVFSPNSNRLASASADKTVKLWDLASGKEIATFTNHNDAVVCVAFSPDGNRLASSSFDHTIKLWDLGSGKEIASFTNHGGVVRSMVFSSDGTRLMFGSDDRTVKLWDLVSSRELVTLSHHIYAVNSVALSPDGTCLASGSFDCTIKLWSLALGKELNTIEGHVSAVSSVVFSPDATRLVTGSHDHTVKLWDLASGREVATFSGHISEVMTVSFSPDGTRVASGSIDNTVKLWDLSSGNETATFTNHQGPVTSVSFSPDGARLVSGSDDHTVRLWDLTLGKEIATFTNHSKAVNCVAFSPDGTRVASGSSDHTVKLWDLASAKEIATFTNHNDAVVSVAFSPEGTHLASGSEDFTIKLWDLASRQELETLFAAGVTSVAFSPDGGRLASGSRDASIKLWDLASRKELVKIKCPVAITSLAFSPDGSRLASGFNDRTVKLWDFTYGQELAAFTNHKGDISSVAFSPDGSLLASGSRDASIKLWDIASGKELVAFANLDHDVYSVVFSPEGNRLASASADNTIKLWDIASGKEIATFTNHNDAVICVAFSPEGNRLASASADNTIKLWDIASGKEISTFTNHNDAVVSVAFSPDGSRLASGSFDRTIKLWDLGSGKEISTFTNHNDAVVSVAFSPDGSRLASGSFDRTIKLWDLGSNRELTTFKGHFKRDNYWKGRICVAFSPDGTRIASGASDNIIMLWDGSNRETMNLAYPVVSDLMQYDGRNIVTKKFSSVKAAKIFVPHYSESEELFGLAKPEMVDATAGQLRLQLMARTSAWRASRAWWNSTGKVVYPWLSTQYLAGLLTSANDPRATAVPGSIVEITRELTVSLESGSLADPRVSVAVAHHILRMASDPDLCPEAEWSALVKCAFGSAPKSWQTALIERAKRNLETTELEPAARSRFEALTQWTLNQKEDPTHLDQHGANSRQ